MDLAGDAVAADQDVGEALVVLYGERASAGEAHDLREAGLLLDIERHIPAAASAHALRHDALDVGLDLRELDPDGVTVAVVDGRERRELEVVARLDLEDLQRQRASRGTDARWAAGWWSTASSSRSRDRADCQYTRSAGSGCIQLCR